RFKRVTASVGRARGVILMLAPKLVFRKLGVELLLRVFINVDHNSICTAQIILLPIVAVGYTALHLRHIASPPNWRMPIPDLNYSWRTDATGVRPAFCVD